MKRMKKLIGFAALEFIALLTLSSPLLAAEQERSAESFEKLRAECIKLAPSGWAVELMLVDAKNPSKPGDCPAIVIHTEKDVEQDHQIPNSSSAITASRATEPVAIRLVAQPYVSPIEYGAIKRRNDEHANQRITMFKRLKAEKVNSTLTGTEPLPPSAFRPTSYTEIRMVWEYAFLWLATEPEPLPTHRFETLTLKVDAPQDVTIRNQTVAGQLKALLEAINKTLTPYESAAKSGEKS
jgi:hypothetical protein